MVPVEGGFPLTGGGVGETTTNIVLEALVALGTDGFFPLLSLVFRQTAGIDQGGGCCHSPGSICIYIYICTHTHRDTQTHTERERERHIQMSIHREGQREREREGWGESVRGQKDTQTGGGVSESPGAVFALCQEPWTDSTTHTKTQSQKERERERGRGASVCKTTKGGRDREG